MAELEFIGVRTNANEPKPSQVIRVVQLRFKDKDEKTKHHWNFALHEQEDFEDMVEKVREKFGTLSREHGQGPAKSGYYPKTG